MKRRLFITLLGGAATRPLAVRAQQPKIPVIGFLYLTSHEQARENLAYFRGGLSETGYIEERNVAIEYRWAHGKNDQLSTLAAELVSRQAVIVTLESTQGALAAKAATQTIVFLQAAEPVRIGLVSNLSKPSGNITGVHLMWAKWLENALTCCLNWCQRPSRSLTSATRPTPFLPRAKRAAVGTLSPSGMAATGCLLVWVDLPGEGDGASRRFRQRGANPREEPGALAALAGIWAGEEQSTATEIAGLDVLLRDEH